VFVGGRWILDFNCKFKSIIGDSHYWNCCNSAEIHVAVFDQLLVRVRSKCVGKANCDTILKLHVVSFVVFHAE